jgi:hypothetical protein
MSRWPLALRVAFDAVALSLALVWIVLPESPTRWFVAGVLALSGLALLPLAVAPWRQAWRRRLDRWLRLPDFAAFTGLLLLLAVESALRLASKISDSTLLAPPNANASERIAQWRGRPGAELNGRRLNAGGFMDEEFQVEKAPGVRRLAAFGDSFALGVVPYAENFLTLLDDQLDAREPTEVQNLGIVSTGPEDYLYLWRTEIRSYQPDLVLVCVFVGNDIRAPRESSLLHRDSLLAFAVPGRMWRLGHQPAARSTPSPEAATFDEASFLAVERDRLDVCRRPLDAKVLRAWDATLSILGQIADEVGPGLRVAIIPDEYQVNDALFELLAAGHEGEYDRDDPQRRLAAWCASRGVPCLDLLPTLREAEGQEHTYKPCDTHWNALGNRVAAQALARWLDQG